MLLERNLTDQIIASAIEVHRELGPGLLESIYEECLCRELHLRKVPFERQKPLEVRYKGVCLNCNYRMDIVVAKKVVVEVKCVEQLALVHIAQVLTYLRLSKLGVGLLMNFYVPVMRNGI